MTRKHLATALLTLCVALAALPRDARAGKIYGSTTFMGPVSVGAWSAIPTSTVVVAQVPGGLWTNAVAYTNWYRLTGTNAAGRLPVTAAIRVAWTGSTNASAVRLSWPRYDGLSAYVVERSYDAGATWTNWLRAGASSTTNWTDTGTNSWTAGSVTSLVTQIPAPTLDSTTVGGFTPEDLMAGGTNVPTWAQVLAQGHTADRNLDLAEHGVTNVTQLSGHDTDHGDAGDLIVRAGASSNSNGGTLRLYGGDGDNDPGHVEIRPGRLISGGGGTINLRSADGTLRLSIGDGGGVWSGGTSTLATAWSEIRAWGNANWANAATPTLQQVADAGRAATNALFISGAKTGLVVRATDSDQDTALLLGGYLRFDSTAPHIVAGGTDIQLHEGAWFFGGSPAISVGVKTLYGNWDITGNLNLNGGYITNAVWKGGAAQGVDGQQVFALANGKVLSFAGGGKISTAIVTNSVYRGGTITEFPDLPWGLWADSNANGIIDVCDSAAYSTESGYATTAGSATANGGYADTSGSSGYATDAGTLDGIDSTGFVAAGGALADLGGGSGTDYLRQDGQWVAGGAGVTQFDGLSDGSTNGAAPGKFLAYNSSMVIVPTNAPPVAAHSHSGTNTWTHGTAGWFDGTLGGTNGIYVTHGGTNYWILTPP